MKTRTSCASALFVLVAIAVPSSIAHSANRESTPRIIITAQDGNLHRLRFVETDLTRLQGEYPTEEIKFKRTGMARVAFRLGGDGHATDPIPDLRTSDVFYQAALKVMGQLRMEYIEGSWPGPINRFVADVVFRVPPCVAETPRMNIDLQLTVCASLDAMAELKWEEPPLPSPPAASSTLTQAEVNCDSPATTLEIDGCLQVKLKQTEAKLNATYQRVIHALSKPDMRGIIHYAEAKQDLIKAQRAWITYREKDCSAVYALAVSGSIRGQLFLECMQKRTEQRIEELERFLEP